MPARLEIRSTPPHGAWTALAALVKAGADGLFEPSASARARAFLSRNAYAQARLVEGGQGGRRRWKWFATQLGVEQHKRLQARP